MRALLYAVCVAAPWALLLSGSPGAVTTTIAASLLVGLLLAVATAAPRVPIPGTTAPVGSAAATRAAPPRLPQHDADAAGHPRPRAPGPGRAVPGA
jgi:hypothetical protein